MLEHLLLIGSLPLLVLLLLVAGLGVPIPEDPVLLAAGVLAHRTVLPWWLVLSASYASVIAADAILFTLARRFGEGLLARRPFRWVVTPARRARVRELFAEHGTRAVFFGRHVPGLRPLVFIFAGVEHMPLRKFLLWDGLAGLITVPAVFGLGYLFSSHVAAVEAGIAKAEHWVAAGVGLIVLIVWSIWSWRRRVPLHEKPAPKDPESQQQA